MGVSKSLKKINYFSDLGNNLTEIDRILEDKRRKEEQRNFYSNVVQLYDAYKRNQDTLNGSNERILKEGGKVSNPFMPSNQKPERISLSGKTPTGMNLNLNIPEGKQPDELPVAPETQTRVVTPEEKYNEAQGNFGNFLGDVSKLIMNPDVDANQIARVDALTNLAKLSSDRMKPKEGETFNLSQGEKRFYKDPSGKIKEIAFNPKQETTSSKTEKKDFKVSEDGFYMYWDDQANNGIGDWVKTSQKAPKEKGTGESVGWARLFYEMNKDNKKEDSEKNQKQAKYNAIMGSPFVEMKDLVEQGLVSAEDTELPKYGGAYVVRDDNNYQNYKLIYSDAELESYAQNQVSDAPNKWNRKDPAGIKDKENDPLGIR